MLAIVLTEDKSFNKTYLYISIYIQTYRIPDADPKSLRPCLSSTVPVVPVVPVVPGVPGVYVFCVCTYANGHCPFASVHVF